MKTAPLFFAIALFFTLFVGCKNDDDTTTDFDSTALIIGLDTAACACCGNWIIEIDGEENPRQFLALPETSEIDLNTATFPLSVNINWTESPSDCRFAVISAIEVN